jgi:4-hydroxy-4-methyl-2-oxoglutarate aldolase
MAITIRKLPPVLETWFLDEAKMIPTANYPLSNSSTGYLGSRIKKISGPKITAGWALPVTIPAGDNLATIFAIQYIREHIGKGRWVIVVSQEEGSADPETAIWGYLQSVMAWEVGIVGAVIAGHVTDIDEVEEKLENEFGLFGWGGSPVNSVWTPSGTIGEPVEINGIKVRAGDLIVGDIDGVVCVPKDQVENTIEKSRENIVNQVNLLQHIREGGSPIEILNLENLLHGHIDIED